MEQEEFSPGDRVRVRDATGEWLARRSVTGVQPGHTFPVVWAAREEEWEAAQVEGRAPDSTPWPAEDVRAVEQRPA